MSLQTAITGLMVAQTGIDTTSNNLANANTTAYKSQTALFESLFPQENGNTKPGTGASVEGMSDDLTEGSLTSTGNSLDAAIEGNGYFVISSNGTQQYTRDGAFQLSNTGQIETLNGSPVQGYSEVNGSLSGSLGALMVNTGSIGATATSKVGLALNLNSGDTVIPSTTAFDPSNSATYSETTSVTAYDAQGNANRVQLYLVNNGSNSWQVYAAPQTASGGSVSASTGGGTASTSPVKLGTLTFNSSGQLTSAQPLSMSVTWPNASGSTSSGPSTINFDLTGTTCQAQSFAVSSLTNNGSAPGAYSGVSIGSDGSVEASYTNGQTLSVGKIAIANFINPEGLTPMSGNLYAQSNSSGTPVVSQAGTGQAGTLKGGELEASNVSTSNMLVSLIQYQQAYEANTSVIQTEQQDSQRLLQI